MYLKNIKIKRVSMDAPEFGKVSANERDFVSDWIFPIQTRQVYGSRAL